METRHGLKATSIAHKIEMENNGYALDMMAAIDAMSSQDAAEDQDWTNETSTYTFNDGSKLVFNGPDFERIEPTEED
jgi:hypothetical protein